MQATLNIVTNPFNPTLDRVQKPIQRKVKINTLVNKHGINLSKPVLCYHNGSPLLRKQWSQTVVKNGDIVSFVYLPEGGGGSNPLKLVLMIAVSVYAPQIALAMGNSIGLAAGSIGMKMLSAGISFLGNALVNALIPPPSPPKAQQQAAMAAPSPTYTIGAQGNQARLGQAIPVLYGTMKLYPDFAAQPYTEFENNDQYLYQLFLITQGRAFIAPGNIFVEDSPISSFGAGESQYEIVYPNQTPTFFPTAVFNCAEVSGQELLGNDTVGPFALNPSQTSINKISFDITLPKGIYYVNDEGGYDTRSLSFDFYVQKIDDAGVTVGPYTQVGSATVSGRSPTPVRKTYSYDVDAGRYLVAMRRVDMKSTDQRQAHDLNWVGARGYSSETIDYGNVTLLAIKLKATNNISSQSSRKINCVAQRLLQIPSYDAETNSYTWGVEQATSSMAWAVADMCRAEYGAHVSESRYNINQLVALHSELLARGDEFNGVFDSSQTFWEALTIACRTCRTRPFVQGGMIHFVRDSLQTLPTALFTSRNMVKGSFKVTYIMNSEDTADCVDVEYYDDVMWKPRIVRAALSGSSNIRPAKVRAFGITNRSQAFREGMKIVADNRYRRKEITFDTELEGHIPALGDLIAIQSDIPEWGEHGEVLSYVGGVVTSSQPLTWTEGAQHYVMLRRANGSSQGPLEVVRGATDDRFTFVVGDEPDFVLYSGHEKEKTFISFGRSGQVVQLAKVLSITPRANTVQISAINEDVRVHSADGTVVPLDTYGYSIPAPSVRPILSDFTITQTGSGLTPSIVVSWQPAPGASKYYIEKSVDNTNWETVGEITSTTFSFITNTGLTYVRVAAFGGVIGPYVTKSINIGQIPPPANVTGGSITAAGHSYVISWTPVVDSTAYYVEVLNAGSVKRSFDTVTTNFDYTVENAIADGGPWRSIDVKVWAVKGGVKSQAPYTLNGTNAAPSAPSMIVTPGVDSASITVSASNEADYAGTMIHASITSGFTPGPGNLIYEGSGNFYMHTGITAQMYYKAAHYDTYGKAGLNYSVEYSATPQENVGGIEVVSTLPTTGNFEGRIVYLTTDDSLYAYDADTSTWVISGGVAPGSITSTELANDAVTAAKISAGAVTANKINVANLTAISANMGNLTSGTITLDNTGHIKGGQTAYNAGTGFFMGYSDTTYKFSIGNSTAGLTWDGAAMTIKGNFNAGSININNKFAVASDGTVTIKSATTGARLEIYNNVIKVFDENNILRVKLGDLSA